MGQLKLLLCHVDIVVVVGVVDAVVVDDVAVAVNAFLTFLDEKKKKTTNQDLLKSK